MKPMKPMAPMEPMAPMRGETPWWPEGLGTPGSTGAQNGLRYAIFPEKRRLLVERDGQVTAYDTGGRRIDGVAQASGGALTVTGPDGEAGLESLARAD